MTSNPSSTFHVKYNQPLSPTSNSFSYSSSHRPSIENAIVSMEKEQEGIVLKLMHEIQLLQDENKQLKQMLTINHISCCNNSNVTSPNCMTPLVSHTPNSSLSSNSGIPLGGKRRNSIATVATQKRMPSTGSVGGPINSIVNTTNNGGSLQAPCASTQIANISSSAKSRSRSGSGSGSGLGTRSPGSRNGSFMFKSPIFQHSTPLNVNMPFLFDMDHKYTYPSDKKRRSSLCHQNGDLNGLNSNSSNTNSNTSQVRRLDVKSPTASCNDGHDYFNAPNRRSISAHPDFDTKTEYRFPNYDSHFHNLKGAKSKTPYSNVFDSESEDEVTMIDDALIKKHPIAKNHSLGLQIRPLSRDAE